LALDAEPLAGAVKADPAVHGRSGGHRR
jgi:hypothetical protein